MTTSFVISNAAPQFPVGTSVGLWLDKDQSPKNAQPTGAQAATATVQANGSLTFTDLTYNTGYVAAADVGDPGWPEWRWRRFRTALDPQYAQELADAVSKGRAVIDASTTTERALEVFVTNSMGRRARFIIENNQDTPEIDIDIRDAVLNIGDPVEAVSEIGKVIFAAPTSDDSNPVQILKPGENTEGITTLYFSRLGLIHCNGWGESSVFYRVQSPSETEPRFQILEGTGVEIHFGPGGATVTDTKIRRAQAGVVEVQNVLQLNTPVTAASVPNNSFFLDSADNIIKLKDNTGTVRTLY